MLNKASSADALVSIVCVKCLVPAYRPTTSNILLFFKQTTALSLQTYVRNVCFLWERLLPLSLSLTMGLQHWTRSGSYDGNNFIVGKNKREKLSTILNSCSYIIALPNPGPQMCCFVGLYASIPSLACSEAGVRVRF